MNSTERDQRLEHTGASQNGRKLRLCFEYNKIYQHTQRTRKSLVATQHTYWNETGLTLDPPQLRTWWLKCCVSLNEASDDQNASLQCCLASLDKCMSTTVYEDSCGCYKTLCPYSLKDWFIFARLFLSTLAVCRRHAVRQTAWVTPPLPAAHRSPLKQTEKHFGLCGVMNR